MEDKSESKNPEMMEFIEIPSGTPGGYYAFLVDKGDAGMPTVVLDVYDGSRLKYYTKDKGYTNPRIGKIGDTLVKASVKKTTQCSCEDYCGGECDE